MVVIDVVSPESAKDEFRAVIGTDVQCTPTASRIYPFEIFSMLINSRCG
jgi:hypothetical protein